MGTREVIEKEPSPATLAKHKKLTRALIRLAHLLQVVSEDPAEGLILSTHASHEIPGLDTCRGKLAPNLSLYCNSARQPP
jgi:hypothetical protein